MQIRIEIDVKPEELRRFLGLPDVAGLQEDVIQFLREKVGAASDSFDPATFVRDNLQTLKRSAAWQKIVSSTKIVRATKAETAASRKPKRSPAKTSARKSTIVRNRSAKSAVIVAAEE